MLVYVHFQATFLHIVPPIVLFLAKHPIVDNYDLSSVHTYFSGAAPLGGDTVKMAMERLGSRSKASFRQGIILHSSANEGIGLMYYRELWSIQPHRFPLLVPLACIFLTVSYPSAIPGQSSIVIMFVSVHLYVHLSVHHP